MSLNQIDPTEGTFQSFVGGSSLVPTEFILDTPFFLPLCETGSKGKRLPTHKHAKGKSEQDLEQKAKMLLSEERDSWRCGEKA